MNAKIGSRYIKEGRTKLETVIPLDTPLILFFDPSSYCNLACKFCPCGNANKNLWLENKKPNILSYELFRKVVDDCTKFNKKLKVLRLYKEGEPLLNKRLPDMINYAVKKNIAESIDFTTNGTLLTPDLNLALIDAGINRINISIEALNAEGYYEISGAKIDFNKFLLTLKHLYKNKQQCHIFIKISDASIRSSEDAKQFYNIFGEMCDEIAIEHITSVWPEFEPEGSKKINIYGDEQKSLEVCPYVFYTICINSDGSVSACLMDWNHKLIVGNVEADSIVDIWDNNIMNRMRIENLKGNRKDLNVCANCGQLKYAAIDNIDNFKEELLKKFNQY